MQMWSEWGGGSFVVIGHSSGLIRKSRPRRSLGGGGHCGAIAFASLQRGRRGSCKRGQCGKVDREHAATGCAIVTPQPLLLLSSLAFRVCASDGEKLIWPQGITAFGPVLSVCLSTNESIT